MNTYGQWSTGVALSLMLASQLVLAEGKVGIPEAVPFAEDSDVPAKVEKECQLGEKVATFVGKYSKNTEISADPGTGLYLNMEITEVHAPAGGGWSGPKWMEVTGTLQENGQDKASFRAKRYSTGGAFSGFKGTCAIIGRCTKAIGKDIAKWLKNPEDGAELGDAR